jgi:predicted transposase YbfD/YdcC
MEIAEVNIFKTEGHRVSVCHGLSSLSNADNSTGQEYDISGLLETLGRVKDRRSRRGRIYGLAFLLAASLVAVLAGATNFRQISDQIADLPQSLLSKLGAKWCYFRGMFGWPSERTIRRVLENVDADELDRAVGAWLHKNARADGERELVLAIDGKVLRGAWTDENEKFTLFSAMIHGTGVTVAQVPVPADTNEITQVEALLEAVPVGAEDQVMVTMDAAHTQRDTAECLKGWQGFDYVMTVKGNQPSLLESVFQTILPKLKNAPDHVVQERGHGRINRWETWTTDATGIDFPHIRQAACIRRNVFTLDGTWTSKEHAWIATSSDTATPADLHTHVRQHWGIENKSHHVRDTTWREDAQQVYTGSGPRVMATLRNMAASLLRLNGFTKIKEATEWIARDRNRALPLLATQSNKRYRQ